MNAVTKPENLPAELQQITINPEQYVAAVYEPLQTSLTTALADEPTEPYDVATTAGMKVAVARRAVFRDIRVATEKARVERKAPILEIGKLLDSSAKSLTALIKPHEDKHDAAIKAEETRKENEKAELARQAEEKARLERERLSCIRENITAIRMMPSTLVGKSAAEILQKLDELVDPMTIPDEFAELIEDAGLAYVAATETMATMHQAAVALEVEQARLAEEKALLEQERLAREEQEKAAAAKLAQDRKILEDEQEEFRKTQAAAKQAEAATESPAMTKALHPAEPAAPSAGFDPNELDAVFGESTQPKTEPARPSNEQIVMLVAHHWNVSEAVACEWLMNFNRHTEAA